MKNLTKMLALGGVILAIFLMTIVRSNAAPGAAQPTKTAIVPQITATLPPPTQTAHPTFTPLPGVQLPQCAFPLSDVLAGEGDAPDLQNYMLSEPKVAVTNDSSLRIVRWISNEEVLLLRHLKSGETETSIEILNIQTSQITQIAKDGKISGAPLWLPDRKAVWYIAYDLYTDPTKNRSRLMVATLDKRIPQLTIEGVTQPLFTIPNGEDVAVLGSDRQRLVKIDIAKNVTTLRNIAELTARNTKILRVAQHPNSQAVALYNDATFVVMDLVTGKTMELNFGKWQIDNRWALDAQWNPDGKHIAVRVTAGRLPNPYSSLLILDIENECSWEIPVSRPFYIYEMAWSPGGRYLLVSGEIGTTQSGYAIIEYRLLDLATGRERKVNLWNGDTGGVYFDWSPDGKTIIINCSTPERGALCTIAVEVEQ
jgi:WD40 repeat protein